MFLVVCVCLPLQGGPNVTIIYDVLEFAIQAHPIQWRIQDFPQGGVPTPKIAIIFQIFTENCMKMKEFGPPGGASLALPWIRQCYLYRASVPLYMVPLANPVTDMFKLVRLRPH